MVMVNDITGPLAVEAFNKIRELLTKRELAVDYLFTEK
jgi:hypothetical protein